MVRPRLLSLGIASALTLAWPGLAAAAEPLPIAPVASAALTVEAPFTVSERPAAVSLGLTPVLASASAASAGPEPLSLNTAAWLTYGSPWAIWMGGSLLLLPLAASPALMPIGQVLSIPIGLAGFLGIAGGYFYAGEPQRGLLVALGQFGIFAGGIGANVLAFGPGQSAGFGIAMTGPLILAALVGYNVWVGFDLDRLVKEKNAALERARHRREFQQLDQ
jgi:hypothetical protein